MKIKKYGNFLNEALDFEDIKKRLDESYLDLKNGLIEIIEQTIVEGKKTVTMIDLEDFIADYITNGKDSNMIDTLIEDNDIFNFYLKFQTNLDELLNDKKYLETTPVENNVYSLYDVVIDGTKQGIIYALEIIQEELFS